MATNLPLPTFAAPRMALFPLLALAIVCGGSTTRAGAQAATVTTLAVTAGGHPATTVSQGTVVTLTAVVNAGAAAVTAGTVNFCDAKADYCTDIHILGTAQVTKAGKATLKLRPGVGAHLYSAVFMGTSANAVSVSGPAALTATLSGLNRTTTTLARGGNVDDYTLTATVAGGGSTVPTGTVSFLDTSNGNALLGAAELTAGEGGLDFLDASNSSVGRSPVSIASGDFNGDGIPDIAVVNLVGQGLSTGTVTVLLGNGDGTFNGAGISITTGPRPLAVAVGDFNSDGMQDLAVTIAGSTNEGYFGNGTVLVLLGNGDGTFRQSASPATGVYPSSLAVGDFNGDGILDLAVTNECGTDSKCQSRGSLTILVGNGAGQFNPEGDPVVTGLSPHSISTTDLNGDGALDLLLLNFDSFCESSNCPPSVAVLLGNGDGTFTSAPSPLTGNDPYSIATGDFNGDGIPDLAVADMSDGVATILLGNGDGSFTATAISPRVGTVPYYLVTGDFNGDGIPDLAVADPNGFGNGRGGTGDNTVIVLLGNGDGTFTVAANPPTGDGPTSMCVADFAGTGIMDLAIANQEGDTVTMLLGEPVAASATVSGITLPLATGQHQVAASYAGSSKDKPSISTPVTLTAPAATSKVTIASSTVRTTFGTPVTFTSSVAKIGVTPTGSVSFKSGSAVLGTGTFNESSVATFTSTTLSSGAYSITAAYAGDKNYKPAASTAVSLAVNKATPQIAVSSSETTVPYHTSVKLTAKLAGTSLTPTGTVTFVSGSTKLGSGTISSSGVAAWSSSALASGNYSIKAFYSGDGNYNAVTSAAVSIGVRRTPSVSLALSVSKAVYGQRVTFTATTVGAGATPTGTVSFLDGKTALGSGSVNSSGIATLSATTLAVGSHLITATYHGDANYLAVTSAASTITVGP